MATGLDLGRAKFWHDLLTLGHQLDKLVGALSPQLASALRR